MKFDRLLLLLCFVTITLSSFQGCNSTSSSRLLPNITGKTGEIIIVIESIDWNSQVGDTLKTMFHQLYPSLPQEESIFTIAHIPKVDFNYVFKTHRNLIFVEINNTLPADSNQIIIKENVWANGQLIFDCKASNKEKIAAMLSEQKTKIISLINAKERERIYNGYKNLPNNKLISLLGNKFGVYMPIPTGFNLNVDTTDFAWMSREDPELSQGIFVYTYPYVDTNTLTLNYLVNKRNLFLKKFVSGPLDGTWMTTEKRFDLQYQEFSFHNTYFFEIRGLWCVENDFMGGPFVSVTTLNKNSNQIITAEGYFYGPKFKKREYIRQLETIIYYMKIINNK